MKCTIVKDLIPLYAEGLCSEETAAEVREHMENCKQCCELLGKFPSQSPSSVPDEDSAMKKVNKKFRRMSLKQMILGFLLISLLGMIVFLSYNQITKRSGCVSFETIFQSIEVRKIGKMIVNQNFEEYVDSISTGDVYSIDQLYILRESRQKDIELLKESYQNAFGSKTVTKIKTHSFYDKNVRGNSIQSDVVIYYGDGTEFTMHLHKGTDGLYKTIDPTIIDNEESEFINAVSYVNYHDLIPNGLIERLIMKRSDAQLYSNRFAMQYRDAVINGSKAFRESGFNFTNVSLTTPTYDEDNDCIRFTITLTAQDEKGTAIAQSPLLLSSHGLIPPSENEVEVYCNNCTDYLADALRHFFG